MVVNIDAGIRIKRQYVVAVKSYLDRNLSRAFDIVYSLIQELKCDKKIVNNKLLVKIVTLYLTLLIVMIEEMVSYHVLKLTTHTNGKLNFIDYYSLEKQTDSTINKIEIGNQIWNDFNNGSNEILNLISQLNLTNDREIMLMYFIICNKSQNTENKISFKNQIEGYLFNQGILPGPSKINISDDINLEKLLKLYLLEITYLQSGIEGVQNVIERIFSSEDIKITENWIKWINEYEKEGLVDDGFNENNNNYNNYDDDYYYDNDSDIYDDLQEEDLENGVVQMNNQSIKNEKEKNKDGKKDKKYRKGKSKSSKDRKSQITTKKNDKNENGSIKSMLNKFNFVIFLKMLLKHQTLISFFFGTTTLIGIIYSLIQKRRKRI
jgi:hypothetical protein